MVTSVSPVVLSPSVQLTTSGVAYITVAANRQAVVKRGVISNTTPGVVTFTLWRVPFGGSAGATNIVIDNRSVPIAPGTDLLPELANMVLNQGDSIHLQASANTSLNFTASGYFVT